MSELIDEDLVALLGQQREREISELEDRLFFHRRPQAEDRPGTRDEWDWRSGLLKHFDLPTWMERYDMPGEFWLPLPPEARGDAAWRQTIRIEMEKHRARWRLLPVVFDTELSLDIAILGASANARDIDNLAHEVLRAFEELYRLGRRGTVVAYRAYRCPADTRGVRVRAMMGERIRQLSEALDAAREHVIDRGPQER